MFQSERRVLDVHGIDVVHKKQHKLTAFTRTPDYPMKGLVQPRVDLVRTDFDGVGPILSGFLR